MSHTHLSPQQKIRSTFNPIRCSFGRKPTVLLTHGLYFLAGAATLTAPNFTVLMICRYCCPPPSPPMRPKCTIDPPLSLSAHILSSFEPQCIEFQLICQFLPSLPILAPKSQAHLSTQVPRGLCAPHSLPLALHHRFHMSKHPLMIAVEDCNSAELLSN